MSSCQTNNLREKKKNKIRKRNFSSSPSSSSSLLRRYRFKRAILVPMRNTKTRSPSMATHHHHDQLKNAALPFSGSGLPCKEKELPFSARKLAATLWEINDLPLYMVTKELEAEQMRSKEKAVNLSRSGLLRPRKSNPSYSPFFSESEQVANQQRHKKSCGKCTVGVENHLKEARSGISTSTKLLNVLNQVCLQEHHSTSIPLVLALGNELDRVRNQIDTLFQANSSNQDDTEYLMKHFAEEKAAWKRREREKVRSAITSIAEELEVEKKLRRQTERLNKKIAKEMANIRASYLKATKELEREKRAKEILEQICDELAKGIGQDRAQVEELKRESAKIREDLEKEREMLQLADVLREERVQMKLSEAKYQFEEKNAVLEKLRNELVAFLRTKEEKENGDVSPVFKKIKDLESYLNNTCWGFQNAESYEGDFNVEDGVEEHEGDYSADSDLHSIELNMDDDNKSYKWSFACENVAQDDSKRVSIDKESIGRKSFSEKIQWGSICFNKGIAISKKRDFAMNIQGSSGQFDQERSIEFPLQAQVQDHYNYERNESYRPIKGPRDCMSCANPAQRSGQLLTLQFADGEAGENALALEGDNLKQEAEGRKCGC